MVARYRKAILLTSVFVAICLAPRAGYSFPELVRHNYVNCTTCHVSPTGGGITTEYGRELSKEVLSTWGKDGEQGFAYGLVKLPGWLNMAGDVRAVQTYRDTPRVREGRFIWMQADLEAAVTYKKLILTGTLGWQELANSKNFADGIISRRHYLNYRPTDELSFRAGRFLPAYGINTPDHVITTRRGLGFDQSSEAYNLEAAWIGESQNVYLTGIFGRPDAPSLNREKGVAAQGVLNFLERYKAGWSYYYGSNSTAKRSVTGPFGILGFTPHFFLLSEFAGEMLTPISGGDSQWRLVSYQRLNYEVHQGVHLYFTHELGRPVHIASKVANDAFGLGTQFFPRPHLELNLLWQRQRVQRLSPEYVDFAWLLFHYYL